MCVRERVRVFVCVCVCVQEIERVYMHVCAHTYIHTKSFVCGEEQHMRCHTNQQSATSSKLTYEYGYLARFCWVSAQEDFGSACSTNACVGCQNVLGIRQRCKAVCLF